MNRLANLTGRCLVHGALALLLSLSATAAAPCLNIVFIITDD